MRITTAYFGPAELKKSEYYDQPRADSACNTLSFSRASYSKRPKLQLSYVYSIKAYTMVTHYGLVYTRCHSAVQTTVYNKSTITQIAIVLFKVRL